MTLVPQFGTISRGEVSEWLKVPLSKSGVVTSYRGFESHPLRRPFGTFPDGRSLGRVA